MPVWMKFLPNPPRYLRWKEDARDSHLASHSLCDPRHSMPTPLFSLPLAHLQRRASAIIEIPMKESYRRWMHDWETRMTSRDVNRVVRPFEWGSEFVSRWPLTAGM